MKSFEPSGFTPANLCTMQRAVKEAIEELSIWLCARSKDVINQEKIYIRG